MDERVLTEHSGTPDAEDTDTFPAVAAARASGDSAAAPTGRAESAETAAPAPAPHAAPAAHTPAAHTPAANVPAGHAARAAPGAAAAPGAPSSRWSQVPYAIALAGMIAGLAWAWQGTAHVRAGMVTVAAVLLAAAVGRLVLPERRAGMLATRHRLLDVVTMLGLGVCILVFAIVLPRS